MELSFKPNLTKEIVSSLLFLIFPLFFILGAIFIFIFAPLEIKIFLGSSLLFLGLLFFSIIMISWGYVANTNYKIDKDFVSMNRIFIQERRVDIPFLEITNIDYNIGFFWDKIFETGTILISTAGSSGVDLKLKGINNVESIYEELSNKLKLSKSVLINKENEVINVSQNNYSNIKSELIKRIKPEAGIAFVLSVFRLIGTIIFLIFYISLDIKDIYDSINIVSVVLISILITIIGSTVTYFAYKKKYYDFYTDKVEYYDGFFTLNKSTIPYERITNIDEHRDLLDRIFDVSKIAIETAGSSMSEIHIKYIKNGDEIVKELKEVLKKNGRN